MATNAMPKRQSASPWQEASHNYALGDMGENVADYVARGAAQIRQITRGHEGSAVLVALAAGFGLGLVIGGIIGSTRSRPRSWRDQTIEDLGQRLLKRIENVLPDALARRMTH